MNLFVCNIAELIDLPEDSEKWQQVLFGSHPKRLEKVKNYKYHEDKARSIAAGFLLGYALKKEYGITSFDLSYGEHGKPYLTGCEGIHFNLSHSDSYVVLGLDEHPCGVDIQKKKALRPGFAKRFFHPEEFLYGEGTMDAQMEIWSMKEALMKYSGKGMSRDLLSFSVVPLLKGESMEEEGRNIVGASLPVICGYSLCVVWEGKGESVPKADLVTWESVFEEMSHNQDSAVIKLQ